MIDQTNKTRLLGRALGLMLLLGVSAPAMAEDSLDAEPERVHITDPAELKALGYPEDSDNVWKLVHPEAPPDRTTYTPEQLAATRQAQRGSVNQWRSYSGFDFLPLTETVSYGKGPSFLIQNGGLVSFEDSAATFEAQLQLPAGAQWQWLEIFGFHDAGANRALVVTAVSRCLGFLTPGNPTETVLATRTINDQGGNFVNSTGMGNLSIEASNCTYHVRTVFDTSTTAPGVQLQLVKVRAEYSLPTPLVFRDRFETP